MLFGYVEDGSYTIKNDEEDPILEADYYFGTNEDGARHSGWLQYTDALTDHDEDYYWFYFNTSNGKKVKDTMKTVSGKKYSFDGDGIMSFKWDEGTVGGVKTTTWFGTLEDGALAKNKWIWNKPYEQVSNPDNQEDYRDETPRWFRTDASGNLVTSSTKKVNSKWYVFDEDGVMLTGLVGLKNKDTDELSSAVSGAYAAYQFDMDEVTKVELYERDFGTALHYFSEDEEKDGSMKTGTMKIELADDEYTFCFTKTTGAAKHGYDSSSKKVYNNGMLQKAGDDKYKVKRDVTTGNDYLVGSTGSIVKNVSKYKDANDDYYLYLKTGDTSWAIYKTSSEDAAKAVISASDKVAKAESLSSVTLVGDGDSTNK